MASDGRQEANGALNTSWCYDWGQGNASLLPDVEWVPNHIYEDWPSTATCGGVSGSCHMKANNEPANSADDHPQSVADILANWENMMRTGMRLCTPSSWDGSDYWNGTGTIIKVFLDSIDARGWRCDIVDAHCYWPEGNFSHLANYWWPNYHRPIWISEWIWGASWNGNGCWGSGVTDAQILSTTKNILNNLNSMGCVERYAYWNSESKGHIYENGALTELGKYYAAMNTGLGYNPTYEKVPNLPRQGGPSNLIGAYDKTTRTIELTWSEPNGEYNRSMVIQQKKSGSNTWTVADSIQCKEEGGSYKVTLESGDGYKFRIVLVDLKGKEYTSNEVTAVSQTLDYGDEISVGEKTMFLGGNLLANGSFEFGTLGWTSGTGEALAAPYFEVVPVGGIDGGAYLQSFGGSSDKASAECVNLDLILKSGATYYAAAAGCNNNASYQRISTSTGTLETNVRVSLQNVTSWAKQGSSFTVANDTICHIRFRNNAGVAQFDDIYVGRLFDSKEEALADALQCAKNRVSAFTQWNTTRPEVNDELETLANATTSATDIDASIERAFQTLRAYTTLDSLVADAQLIVRLKMAGHAAIAEALAAIETVETPSAIIEIVAQLREQVNATLTYTAVTDAISAPNFSTTTGWTTLAGTYTGGDQRTATQAGLTCWNAWWNISANGNADKTMAVKQEVKGLAAGLYALQCKATTQHLCETDQHAFLTNQTTGESVKSVTLPYGVLDLPGFSDKEKWCQLVTPYISVSDGDVVTVGFEGSKAGATDKSWIKYGDPSNTGDNREGWWCATDFSLRQVPLFIREVDESGWGTICLPYAFSVPEGVTIYRIAGILADCTAICLEEETEPITAGCPYVFHVSDGTTAYFFEDVSYKASVVNTNYHGLRGAFSVSAKYPIGSIVLANGVWTYTVARTETIISYSGYIQKALNLTVLNEWDGVKLPTSGVEEIKTGLDRIEASANDTQATYDLAGRRIGQQPEKGLVIRRGVVMFVK